MPVPPGSKEVSPLLNRVNYIVRSCRVKAAKKDGGLSGPPPFSISDFTKFFCVIDGLQAKEFTEFFRPMARPWTFPVQTRASLRPAGPASLLTVAVSREGNLQLHLKLDLMPQRNAVGPHLRQLGLILAHQLHHVVIQPRHVEAPLLVKAYGL